MKKLVVFDLDGTLVNSIADLGNACNHALEQMGFPPHSKTSYNYLVGNGISKLIERALPEDSRRQRVIEAMKTRFIEYYNEHLWEETTVYEGITELLEELTRRDIKVAVTSNKYQHATSRIIEHFFPQIPWVSVMGHQDLMPLKPDPSVLFAVLLQSPTPKAETIYVGDSAIDMETAYRACVDSIGVTWGFRSRAELVQANATHIVSHPSEILKITE